MKLRNKGTGEIREARIANGHLQLWSADLDAWFDYDDLDYLAKWWERYEKPKEVWYITSNGEIESASADNSWVMEKAIGNYFESKKDAEDALEKLWAWKRLKDAGVKIVGWCYSDDVDLNGCGFNDDDFIVGLTAGECDQDDLDLLFGGGE